MTQDRILLEEELAALETEKEQLLINEPEAEKFIKKLISAKEYLNNGNRYCLWLVDITPSELNNLPITKQRVEKVRQHRLESIREATRILAEYPTLFGENRQPKNDYILVPRHSSENREYVPFGFFNSDYIVSDSCLCIPNADLFDFGIISSKMHMTWMRYVCGRLKGDYRYSNKIVYNTFPFPNNVTEGNMLKVIDAVQLLLNERDKFKNESLAQLYDPNIMPPSLWNAHKKLDNAVDKCYRRKKFKDDIDRIKFLFDLYIEYIG